MLRFSKRVDIKRSIAQGARHNKRVCLVAKQKKSSAKLNIFMPFILKMFSHINSGLADWVEVEDSLPLNGTLVKLEKRPFWRKIDNFLLQKSMKPRTSLSPINNPSAISSACTQKNKTKQKILRHFHFSQLH